MVHLNTRDGSVPFDLLHGQEAVDAFAALSLLDWKWHRYVENPSRALVLGIPEPAKPPIAYLVAHRPTHLRRFVDRSRDARSRDLYTPAHLFSGAGPADEGDVGGQPGSGFVLQRDEDQLLVDAEDISLFVFRGDTPPRSWWKWLWYRPPRVPPPYGRDLPKRSPEEIDWWFRDQKPRIRDLSVSGQILAELSPCTLKLAGAGLTYYERMVKFRAERAGSPPVEFLHRFTSGVNVRPIMHNASLRLATEEELVAYASTLPDWLQPDVQRYPEILGIDLDYHGAGRLLIQADEGDYGVWADRVECSWLGSDLSPAGIGYDFGGMIWDGGPRLDGDWYGGPSARSGWSR